MKDKLDYLLRDKIKTLDSKIKYLDSSLDALNPTNILQKGYTITRASNGKIVKSAKELEVGSITETVFKDGIVVNKVEEVKENE